MGSITLTLPTGGTVITAALHNTNYSTLQTVVNGNIEDVNVKAGAAIAYSKLSLANTILTTDISTGAGNAWQTYVPVWSSAATAPVLNNGTIAGRYIQIGKTVFFSIHLVAGTTTTFGGANPWTFTIPVAAQSAAVIGFPIGGARSLDSSGTVGYAGALISASSTTVFPLTSAQPTVVYNSTTPFAWAVSDEITVNGTYEAA
jgi:hypothetical protein